MNRPASSCSLSSLPLSFSPASSPFSLLGPLTHDAQVSRCGEPSQHFYGQDLVLTPPWGTCLCLCVALRGRSKGLKRSLDSALPATCHRGRGSFFLYKYAILPHPLLSPQSLGLLLSTRNTLSNSPTQRGSHFQMTSTASRAVALTCEAGVIFHIKK